MPSRFLGRPPLRRNWLRFRQDRLGVFVFLLVCSTLILWPAMPSAQNVPRTGDIAIADVFAPRGFVFVDNASARRRWESLYRSVPAPYRLRTEGFEAAARRLRGALTASLPDTHPLSSPRRRQVAILQVNRLLRKMRSRGYSDSDIHADRLSILLPNGKRRIVEASSVVQKKRLIEELPDLTRREAEAVARLISEYIPPTLVFDSAEANRILEKIRQENPPARTRFAPEKAVIVAGQRLAERDVELIRQLNEYNRKRNLQAIGLLLLFQILLLSFAALYMKRYLFEQYENTRDIWGIAFTFLASLFLCLVVLVIVERASWGRWRLTPAVLPVPALAMTLTLLYGVRLAFIATMFLSLLASTVMAPRVSILAMFLLGAMTASFAAVHARKRSDLARAGLWTGLVQAFVIVSLGIIYSQPWSALRAEILSGFGSGILSSLLVSVLLLPLEVLSHRPSSFRLLELTDPQHPVLQQLLRTAPGTFQHSQHVALLAQTAAETIGANALLTRVGAYFHDIGKMKKPEYFTENQQKGANPHDSLSPTMSATILKAHVTDGAQMARVAKLPDAVIDFIWEHHGTTLMSVFYARALEQAGDEDVDKSKYRYPGPRPQSVETALVMLADSVEAASRSLERPTPNRLERLVKKIITDKFEEEQLDDCGLTLRELNLIADEFTRVLSGLYHSRNVVYPEKSGGERKKS